MKLLLEMTAFILGSIGYAFRGWIGKGLLTVIFAFMKFMLHMSERELEQYHARKQARLKRQV